MIDIKIHDLPLSDNETDKLTTQYSVSKKEMIIALKHIEDSIDATDTVSVRMLLHHMFNYYHKITDAKFNNVDLASVSKRFIIEVFLNDRRLEYRASDNETDIDKELIELKRTYKSSNCIFYKGELNVC